MCSVCIFFGVYEYVCGVCVVCIFVYTCVWVVMYLSTHAHVCSCMWRPKADAAFFLYSLSTLHIKPDFLLNVELANSGDLTSQLTPKTPVSISQVLRLQVASHLSCQASLWVLGNLKSGPHAYYVPGVLACKLSSQLSTFGSGICVRRHLGLHQCEILGPHSSSYHALQWFPKPFLLYFFPLNSPPEWYFHGSRWDASFKV